VRPRTAGVDLSDLEFWGLPVDERMAAFARLRELDEPAFFAEQKIPFIKAGRGYYALTRYADVVEASRNPDVFSSEPASNSIPDMPRWLATYFGSMINMDDPRHAKIRRIVSRAFTPKMLSGLDDDLHRITSEIVDGLIARGSGDFVSEAAARLPIQVICAIMGISERHHPMVLARTNRILGGGDPEYTGMEPKFGKLSTAGSLYRLVKAGRDLHRLAASLGRERRANPTGDLTSALVTANVDGESLTDQEFGSFFILLVVAGNETTRNAIAHGLKAFTDFPEQRATLLSDVDKYMPSAVDEIVRFATPVTQFRRTLTRDHEMGGHRFARGDKVLLYYNAANRDPSVFDRPDEFDVTRVPNPHLGFGGPGPHFCLGAPLARREITVMFRELFERAPTIRTVGEPDRLLSGFINGIKRIRYEIPAD
jgi:methyl-branched lipid omega-hydroxylase